MQRYSGVMVAMAAAASVMFVAGVATTGCSSQNSTSTPPLDGGEDVTADAGPDGTSEDSAMAETGGDVSNESSVDSGAPPDSSNASDAGDSAPGTDAADSGYDGAALVAFDTDQARAICTFLLGCCPGGLSTHDLNECISVYQEYGWEGNVPPAPGTLLQGHMAIDATAASNCLATIATLNSNCGAQTAASWTAVTQACELVITGTLPNGSGPCQTSFQCATGYCSNAVDGGQCMPLQAQGQSCDTRTLADAILFAGLGPVQDYRCSYLGSGNTGQFCDLIDAPDASTYGTCQPLRAAGSPCGNATYYDDQACAPAAALCGDTNLCGSSASYPYPYTCNFYKIQDAGGGG